MSKKENLFGAYPGSLVARNFAEGDDNFHGYLLWDIEDHSVEEIEIKNKYSYKNITVNQFTDFDDLDFDIDNPTELMRVRIIWDGYSSQYKTDNLDKIKSYLNSKYNIIEIKNKKNFLNEKNIEVENESDLKIENISTQDGQHKLFKEFLEQLGVDEDVINKIIDLDNEITKRLPVGAYDNILWKPIKIKGKNFRSFVDFELDFRDVTGVFQILGNNQVGKTTVHSLISYVLFGKTIETEKRQKNGDNRFINNKVNDDFCFGDIIFEANNEYYGVNRYTKRDWNSKKTEIKSVSSSVNYYKLANPDEEFSELNKIDTLNEDIKVKTQRVIDNIVNDYENFKRLVLTTGDTLNDILKIDKSEFIDNILYNLGMDFFDNKLEEFKIYKKEYNDNNPKINVSVETENKKIEELNESNISINKELDIAKTNIEKLVVRKVSGQKYKDNLIKSLHKIDNNILNINLDQQKKELDSLNLNIEKKREIYVINSKSIKSLPKEFDDTKLNELNQKHNDTRNSVYVIKDKINEVKKDINDVESEISKHKTNIFLLEKENKSLENKIKELENSKTCPTCNQELKEKQIETIKDAINKNHNFIKDNLKKIIENNEEIGKLDKNILVKKDKIIEYNNDINKINEETENLLIRIGKQDIEKKKFQERNELQLKNEKLKIEADQIQVSIKEINDKLELYDQNLNLIEENKKINLDINVASTLMDEIENNIISSNRNQQIFDNNIKNNDNEIKLINDKINRYNKQVILESIHKLYEQCVHRNGIPTLLLKKYSLPEINNTLNKLLVDVPFNVWIDEEDLTLKMCDINNTNIVIDCLSGSGKERTFSAISLKHSLNELNIKSKPSLLILDEITGKLIGDSISEFTEILNILKTKIYNIIVIEHVHDINPDHVMEIEKNEKGISSVVKLI